MKGWASLQPAFEAREGEGETLHIPYTVLTQKTVEERQCGQRNTQARQTRLHCHGCFSALFPPALSDLFSPVRTALISLVQPIPITPQQHAGRALGDAARQPPPQPMRHLGQLFARVHRLFAGELADTFPRCRPPPSGRLHCHWGEPPVVSAACLRRLGGLFRRLTPGRCRAGGDLRWGRG